jgi:hypothetical protein
VRRWRAGHGDDRRAAALSAFPTGPDEPTVALVRFDAAWADDDPYAGLKADVAAHGHLDPLATLAGLSEASGVPVGALARYVLARWAAGGNEALLELGTSGVDQLARVVGQAEAAGTDEARLAAYATVRELVGWLRAGLDPPAGDA